MKLRVGELRVLERKIEVLLNEYQRELDSLTYAESTKRKELERGFLEEKILTLQLASKRCSALWMLCASRLANPEINISMLDD